jgi:indole-3-glycerol phosphate synthase
MEKANKLKPEKIFITDFKIIQGQIESPFDFDTSNVKGFQFNLDYNTGFNIEDKLAKVDLKVFVETESKVEQQEAKGMFHFVFIYNIENLEELVTAENETYKIHTSLGNALASITYSTSRGILMTRFQGTVLSDFILPIVNPNDLFDK